MIASIKNSAENEAKTKYTVVIYDDKNTEAPTLTIKEEYRTLALDEDTTKINWKGDFVETAFDKEGLSIKNSVTADLTELDTTAAGKYNVNIKVTDYTGNVATEIIEVTVK